MIHVPQIFLKHLSIFWISFWKVNGLCSQTCVPTNKSILRFVKIFGNFPLILSRHILYHLPSFLELLFLFLHLLLIYFYRLLFHNIVYLFSLNFIELGIVYLIPIQLLNFHIPLLDFIQMINIFEIPVLKIVKLILHRFDL